jgi:hypothetical protein
MAREPRGWWSYLGPLEWAVWAALVLFGHVLLSALLITLIWGVTRWTHYLYGNDLPLIWGVFPFEYLSQTMDVGVIVVFFIQGIRAAWRELGRQEANQ